MRTRALLAALTCVLSAGWALGDDDPVKGVYQWQPGIRRDANEVDKTDYWSAIALSPSTGKYAAVCWETSQDNAVRRAREKCNAKDARAVVLCGNGWCSLALGAQPKAGDGDVAWGVGYAETRAEAEKFALENARKRDAKAAITFSVYAREFHATGAIAYSPTTGKCGYSCGYGRGDVGRAQKFSGDTEAKYFVTTDYCSWLAVATGDDKTAYGWGRAGNRADAERIALQECGKRTTNPKVGLSFCTNGKQPDEK